MLVCSGKWVPQAYRVKGECYALELDCNLTAIQIADDGVPLLGVERADEVKV
jgi:hypothetical protein